MDDERRVFCHRLSAAQLAAGAKASDPVPLTTAHVDRHGRLCCDYCGDPIHPRRRG